MAVFEGTAFDTESLGLALLDDLFPQGGEISPPNAVALMQHWVFFRDPLDPREVRGGVACRGRTVMVQVDQQEHILVGHLPRQILCRVPWHRGMWLEPQGDQLQVVLLLPLLGPLSIERMGVSVVLPTINETEALRCLRIFLKVTSLDRVGLSLPAFRTSFADDREEAMFHHLLVTLAEEMHLPMSHFEELGLLLPS